MVRDMRDARNGANVSIFKWFLGTVCALCLACSGYTCDTSGQGHDGATSLDVATTDSSVWDVTHSDGSDSASDATTDTRLTGDEPTTPPTPRCGGTIGPGSLVRGSGPAVYYIARDNRRYVFPNRTTYFSWYPTFEGICQIPDARLAAIYIGGNVTFRPGTWLAKITTDPKVYAVTRRGVLHWIENEALALQLYGPTWNRGLEHDIPTAMVRRTRDVPDAFFVNYSVGASISRPVHPDGTLVRYAGNDTIYLVMGGQKRRVTPEGFTANRFNRWFVVETDILYPDSIEVQVTGYECELADPVCP